MILKIYDTNSINETDDKQMFLQLIKDRDDDDIGLSVVDKKGTIISSLLYLDQRCKSLILVDCNHPDIPVKTNFKGEVLIVTSKEFKNFQSDIGMKHIMRNIFNIMETEEQEQASKH